MLTDIVTSAHRQNNPWWEGYPLDSLGGKGRPARSPLDQYINLEDFSRSEFKHQFENVKQNRLYILAAPNGIGKTTTLCHIANRFGQDDFLPAENLFYFPCEKPLFNIDSEFPITDGFDWYHQNIYESYQRTLEEFADDESDSVAEENEDIYLFLDNAHLISGWGEEAIALLDKHPELNIIATTPSAEAINPERFESADFSYDSDILLPRKFHDWVASDDRNDLKNSEYKSLRRELRDSFAAFAGGKEREIEGTLRELSGQLSAKPDELDQQLDQYTKKGDNHRPSGDVEHDIQLAIFRDMPQIQSISSPSELYILVAIATVHASNPRTMKEWSSMLDVDRRTLDRYLKLLEEFYLVTPSSHYEHDVRRSLRLYPRDPAHIDLLGEGSRISNSSQNRALMSVLFDHCKRLSFHLNPQDTPVEYWESSKSTIDYIIQLHNQEYDLPITFARNNYVGKAIESMNEFCDVEDENRPTHGVIISPEGNEDPTVDSNSGHLILPAWLFLYIV